MLVFIHVCLVSNVQADEKYLIDMLYIKLSPYSLSHIVQITDFLDFLNEYCEEKSETFAENNIR